MLMLKQAAVVAGTVVGEGHGCYVACCIATVTTGVRLLYHKPASRFT
jgi:hypothetical protein